MDPDATLEDILYCIEEHETGGDFDIDEFVQHVRELNDWLSTGGALPTMWE